MTSVFCASSFEYEESMRNEMDEDILNKIVTNCVKRVLDDPFIGDFDIVTPFGFHGDIGRKTQFIDPFVIDSSLNLARILREAKGMTDIGGSSKGTGVFHPCNTFSGNYHIPKTHFGTGVFIGNVHQKRNKMKTGKNVHAMKFGPKIVDGKKKIDPKNVEGEKEALFEMFDDICLPSEWPY